METKSHKIEIINLDDSSLEWFIETAAINMLKDELKRPELIDLDRLYSLSLKGMKDGTAFVAKNGSSYCGVIGGLLHENIFNPKYKTLTELFWYVLPEYRNGRAGLMLLKAFDNRAKEIADDSTLCLLPSSQVNIGSLEKRGYKLNEYAFRKVY